MKRLLERISLTKREAVRAAIPVLALVLVASVVTGRERPAVVAEPPTARLNTKIEISDSDLDVDRLRRERAEGPANVSADPFARRSFGTEPPAQPVAAVAPQPPQAPPLPFTYLGKVIEDGKLSVFLARGDDSYSVSPGRRRRLDDRYRVDKVTESAVVFTYLPLNQKQVLDIPAVNQ